MTNTYIVTGASSGIGENVALKLNSLGYNVVAVARNQEKLSKVKNNATNKDLFHIEIKDLTKDIEKLPDYITELKDKYGKFSGLIYCAGMSDITPLRILDYKKTKTLFDINYFAPLFLAKGILDKRNNTKENVSVIAIASVEAGLHDKGMSIYCASKSALISSMKCIAKEYLTTGARINTISPGYVDTPLLDEIMQMKEINKESGLIINPEEISNLVAYMISPKCPHMSGSDVVVGGETI